MKTCWQKIAYDYSQHLFIIAKGWKQSKCPSADKWINKLWYIHTMEYCLVIRRNKILVHATTWKDLENIHVQWSKPVIKYHIIYDLICMKYPNRQTGKESSLVAASDPGETGRVERKRSSRSLWVVEKFWNETVVMVAHWVVHLTVTVVNLRCACVLYHIENN